MHIHLLKGDTAMDNKVNTYVTSLKELLNRNNTKLPLTIPDYQRPYTWKAKNVIQLLDDVVRFSKFPEYRIGTIILHKNGTTLDIVDGQQRIITSLLITRYLNDKQRKELTSIDIPEHQRTIENVVNNNKVIGEYFERNPHSKEIIEDYFLSNCTVQVLELANLDEAFQLFDSSNNRGKALYPTDLLKAFHLRELKGTEERKLEMVELWENIQPSHIHTLFSEYLFRIKQWSKNKNVSDLGFSNNDIDLFKGVSEGDDNSELNWAKPFLMAKNYVDTFNRQNQTMIEFHALPEMNYAFQIDQPMINGEYFFKFVDFYNKILEKQGFYSDEASPGANSILSLFAETKDKKYFRFVQSLYKTSMLYAIDKFSDSQYSMIENICFHYAYYPRFYFEQVQKKSINKFVINSDADIKNLFNYIAESYSTNQLSHFEVPIDDKLKDSQREKVKNKSPKIAERYLGGED